MSSQDSIRWRTFRRLSWIAVPLVVGIVSYRAMRWAEAPRGISPPPASSDARNFTMRLEGGSYVNYVDGRKAWSVAADRIDLDRSPGTSLTSLQGATLTALHDGRLFELRPGAGVESGSVALGFGASAREQVVASFSALHGRYSVGPTESAPPDITSNYAVEWQLKLMDDVRVVTKAGDKIMADSFRIVEIMNRQSGLRERRMYCEAGMRASHGATSIIANQARFAPNDRVLDCQGGVRLLSKRDSVQADRLFWSFKDETARCPEVATGVLGGMAFSATNLALDLKRHHSSASRIQLQLRSDQEKGVLSP